MVVAGLAEEVMVAVMVAVVTGVVGVEVVA